MVSNGEVDEEEGHPGSFGVHFFPGEVVEGEGVGADAEQAQDAESRDFKYWWDLDCQWRCLSVETLGRATGRPCWRWARQALVGL